MHQHSADGGAEAASFAPVCAEPIEKNPKSEGPWPHRRWPIFVAVAVVVSLLALPSVAQEEVAETTSVGEASTTSSSVAETTSTSATETTSANGGDQTTSTGSTAGTTDTAPATSETTEATTTTSQPATTAEPAPTPPPTTAAPVTTEPASATTSATTAPQPQARTADAANDDEFELASARLSELEKTLAETESRVSAEAAKVDVAKYEFEVAQALVDATAEQVRELETQVLKLEIGLENQAIETFKDSDLSTPVMVGRDPTEALRMQAMLAKATETDIDYANLLDAAKEELLGMRRGAERAAAEAERLRNDSKSTLEDLEAEQDRWRRQAVAAEARLDYLLSEQAALVEIGADADAGLDLDINQGLIDRLQAVEVPTAPPPPAATTGPVTEDQIVEAANGIRVHVSVADDVRQLLADAAADGVELRGGGYRSPAGQIAVRKNNCGTSNYAIYEMPSSRCSPPTARPGKSMHEQGKAIDFTYNGTIIRYRSGPAWEWLKANASKYGFYNLPSEPWHWSTNGR